MPPPHYSPITNARRRLFDEDPPAQYFAPASEYRTADAMAADRAAMDEIAAARDAALTKLMQNQYARQDIGARSRILPYSTAAQIAQEKLQRTRATNDEELDPFRVDATRERYLTDVDQEQSTRRQIPTQELVNETDADARLKAAQDADPHYTRLTRLTKNDPHAAALYEARLRNSPAKSREEARQLAYGDAMKLVRDREAVNAIDAMDANDGAGTRRDELLEDVEDDETGEYLGSVIRRDATPEQIGKVTSALRTSRNEKRLNAIAKTDQERMARGITALDHAISGLSRRITAYEKLDQADTPEITSARNEMDRLSLQRVFNMEKMGIITPGNAAPAATAKAGKPSYFTDAMKAAQK